MNRFRSNICFQTLLAFVWFLAPENRGLAQWPQYGGNDGDFRGSATAKLSSDFGNWSIELGLGDSAPIVDQGIIVVSEASFTESGQEAMSIRAIHPSSGKTVWATTVDEKCYTSQDINDNYPVRPLASPLAAANRIVAVSFGGCVSCLDQATGQVVWRHDLVQEFQATPIQYGFASSPWSDGSRVVLACGGPQALIVAFDLADGKLAWKSSPGEAGYGSFAVLKFLDESKHLCYMARDVLIGIDSESGRELWNYPLPNPGLTNAVTPIGVGEGGLIVGGQGFDSSRRLRVQDKNGTWTIDEVWKFKQSPFYCNSVVADSREIFGYKSNALCSVDLETGMLKWRVRGWTDANFAINGDRVVGVRGDGYLALARLTNDGISVSNGARVVNDRVWAPPVVINKTALIRGRNSLSAVDLDQLPSIDQLPSGTEIDAMTAMYGKKHESIVNLLELASTEPTKLTYKDYRLVVDDRSIRFGESEYRALFESLSKSNRLDVMSQIAKDWSDREPNSIVAFDKLVEFTQSQGLGDKIGQLLQDRLVEVVIEVQAPETTDEDAKLYLAGNATAVGSWAPNFILLERSHLGLYRGTALIPKGQFEFKITQGSWDTVEVRSDGRSTSNRRQMVVQSTTIRAEVQAWKNKAAK